MKEGTSWERKFWNRFFLGLAIAIAVVVLAVIVFVPSEVAEERGSAAYGWLNEETVTLTATGSAGAATGTGITDSFIRGRLLAIHVDYGAGGVSTTDITFTLASPALTLLTLTDANTDAWYYPAIELTGATGSGFTVYDRTPISGQLSIAAAGSNAGTVAVITFWYGE
jgi:hypothetical protein